MSARALFVAVALALSSAPVAAADARWWHDAVIQRDLALSAAQVAMIDRIYESTLPERRALRARLDRENQALADAMALGTLTDAEAQVLITRVEAAQIRRNVARTLLLVRIYHTLTPVQRRQLRQQDQRHR